MTRTLTKTVALVGMMGAGKSAVGKALAERLNV
ncbi:MAG: shikimate kinase, partial [Paracoccaceae bacterium]